MLTTYLAEIFERDLNKLSEELNAYTDENKIWLVEKGISNSAGNLSLHLIGNLNHFIGATLGATGYVRDRDSEFALKNIPRTELIAEIGKTCLVVKTTLGKLSQEDLDKTFPIKVKIKEGDFSTGFMLVHLLAHLNYHLGQINYHRRLLA